MFRFKFSIRDVVWLTLAFGPDREWANIAPRFDERYDGAYVSFFSLESAAHIVGGDSRFVWVAMP